MLFLGFDIERFFEKEFLPKSHFFFSHDEIPTLPAHRRAAVFDPAKNSLSPFTRIDYHYATYLVEAINAAFPGGENTLTKSAGLTYILAALLNRPKSLETLIPEPTKKSSSGHIWAYEKVQRILLSPTLQRVFDPDRNQFKFNPHGVVLARINRAELTDFDADILTYFLIGQHKGTIVLPNLPAYAHDGFVRLITEKRLIAGVHYLDQLTNAPALRQALLTIKDKRLSHVLYKDAVELAELNGLRPDFQRINNPYNNFIDAAMHNEISLPDDLDLPAYRPLP